MQSRMGNNDSNNSITSAVTNAPPASAERLANSITGNDTPLHHEGYQRLRHLNVSGMSPESSSTGRRPYVHITRSSLMLPHQQQTPSNPAPRVLQTSSHNRIDRYLAQPSGCQQPCSRPSSCPPHRIDAVQMSEFFRDQRRVRFPRWRSRRTHDSTRDKAILKTKPVSSMRLEKTPACRLETWLTNTDRH
ncbi:uncharacterized protein M421DRAFT_271516 [Didymella exigua CBS 183.55]|uniref:Uncharacterized protein n=1 Tax=Didymella exigua CBS 183.55 TaxID=1150837 RepID=A0A6A5RGT7_9PLEO|nr:uncharacterized protein M421DRAFT_271516 [Didymella exigua CBS 183.55]KAF1924827.1 hypothetical protein M421DRAFT_271516 [Didymella exigua CBS 183.55]